MGASLKYTVGDRTVSRNQFVENMKNEAVKLAKDGIVERIESVRCPVHGEHAKNIQTSSSGDKLGFTFTACCEQLKEEVAKAFQ